MSQRESHQAIRHLHAEIEKGIIGMLAALARLHRHHPELRNKDLTNLVRNLHIYIFVTYKREICSPPMSWTEIHEHFKNTVFTEDKREVLIYIPERGGGYKKTTMTVEEFETAMGMKWPALSKSGIRNAVREGKKIYELVHEAIDQNAGLFERFYIKTVRHPIRARALVVREQSHIVRPPMVKSSGR